MLKPLRQRIRRRITPWALVLALACAPTMVAAQTTTPTPPRGPGAPVFEPIVMGHMTWSFTGTAPDAIKAQITASMTNVVNVANTIADYTFNVPVYYNSGIPTAQANHGGTIGFGASRNPRATVHELSHFMGTGTYYPAWGNLMVGGLWQGQAAKAMVQSYDGPTAVLHGDTAHYWPYGENYDSEGYTPQRTLHMASALRQDMGLANGVKAISGRIVRLQNRSSGLLAHVAGTIASQAINTGGKTQYWRITPVDGYITLQNPDSSLVLEDATGIAGFPVEVHTLTSADTQQWEMVPTDNGWFHLVNRSTKECLDNLSQNAIGAEIGLYDCDGSANQQWHFAN